MVAAPALAQHTAVPSVSKRFIVALEAPDKPVALNTMHSRVVRVTSPDGTGVADAKIGIDGGMAHGRTHGHAHGLPTAPQVTQYLGDGRYLIEGLKFNMRGKWELKLSIDAAGQSDSATFDLVLQ